jgi:DNA-directed RNA polymerase specialized sigma24 family protein
MGLPLLRVRSDEQLVALFRDGYDDAFRAMHDRYHKRLLAYMRQMLPRRQDAEDALQEVFVRAYFGLRAHDRELSLRAWLFRVAHNRCIDELRRPPPPPPPLKPKVPPPRPGTPAPARDHRHGPSRRPGHRGPGRLSGIAAAPDRRRASAT